LTALLELRSAGLTGRLQPVKLRLFAGQKVVLLGRSGAGKSSLIGLCNGELSPDRGVVLWQEKPSTSGPIGNAVNWGRCGRT